MFAKVFPFIIETKLLESFNIQYADNIFSGLLSFSLTVTVSETVSLSFRKFGSEHLNPLWFSPK